MSSVDIIILSDIIVWVDGFLPKRSELHTESLNECVSYQMQEEIVTDDIFITSLERSFISSYFGIHNDGFMDSAVDFSIIDPTTAKSMPFPIEQKRFECIDDAYRLTCMRISAYGLYKRAKNLYLKSLDNLGFISRNDTDYAYPLRYKNYLIKLSEEMAMRNSMPLTDDQKL